MSLVNFFNGKSNVFGGGSEPKKATLKDQVVEMLASKGITEPNGAAVNRMTAMAEQYTSNFNTGRLGSGADLMTASQGLERLSAKTANGITTLYGVASHLTSNMDNGIENASIDVISGYAVNLKQSAIKLAAKSGGALEMIETAASNPENKNLVSNIAELRARAEILVASSKNPSALKEQTIIGEVLNDDSIRRITASHDSSRNIESGILNRSGNVAPAAKEARSERDAGISMEKYNDRFLEKVKEMAEPQRGMNLGR